VSLTPSHRSARSLSISSSRSDRCSSMARTGVRMVVSRSGGSAGFAQSADCCGLTSIRGGAGFLFGRTKLTFSVGSSAGGAQSGRWDLDDALRGSPTPPPSNTATRRPIALCGVRVLPSCDGASRAMNSTPAAQCERNSLRYGPIGPCRRLVNYCPTHAGFFLSYELYYSGKCVLVRPLL
jgi:hypothetical protein